MDSTAHPLAGLYRPTLLKGLYYGPGVVNQHLLSCLPSKTSKAFVITGNSLATKTPLVKQVEELLGKQHAGTFSNIKEHAPVAQLDEATEQVKNDPSIDAIISLGGGSPIDSAKAISHRVHESTGHYLLHITIPTTLSAAEATGGAAYTQASGVKTGLHGAELNVSYIIYDADFALHTPPSLFSSTGLRALDHAIELQYHPTASEIPCRQLCRLAMQQLFEYLPKYKANPQDKDVITRLFLAAFASLGFLGLNIKGSLGLSHTMGYALGSPYGIPHGITSAMTLGHVIKLKARTAGPDAARNLAIAAAMIGVPSSGDDIKDADALGDRVLQLVQELGHKTTLTEKGVGRDQVDVICSRALGGLNPAEKQEMTEEQKKQLDGVRKIVEGLY